MRKYILFIDIVNSQAIKRVLSHDYDISLNRSIDIQDLYIIASRY